MELLELYLSPINKSRFKVIVTRSPVGEAETESKLPFFKNRIDRRVTVLKALGASNFQAKDFQEDGELDWMIRADLISADLSGFHPNLLANIGRELYRSIFPVGSQVERALQRAITLAESRQNPTQLHIRLGFAADVVQHSRIADYPWELMHDSQKFLTQHQVVFSRYIAHDTAPPNLPPMAQVNVLLVSSAAYDEKNGLKPLSIQERDTVREGLRRAKQEGRICLTELRKATLRELRSYLTEHRGNETPHVLHFDGHGFFGKRCKNEQCLTIHQNLKINKCKACGMSLPNPQGYVVFETDEGKPDYVSAKELGTLLQQASFGNGISQDRSVTVAVLSACKSARSLASDSVFDGVAQNLINCRVPAVVAMQYLVRVDSAINFVELFYCSLGQQHPLATAVSKGREAMGFEGNQWYRPVLYLRWKDNEGGQLFAVEQETSPPFGKLSEPLKFPSHWQPDLINILLHQRDCIPSVQSQLELTNAIGELEHLAKEAPSLQIAERWLGDEYDRWKLASILTKKALPVSYLKTYPTPKSKKEAKNKIQLNLYNCLNWLSEAFQTGFAKEIDNFKECLIEHPLKYYVDALNLLKDKAKQDFSSNEDVINIINDYIEILSNKIGV